MKSWIRGVRRLYLNSLVTIIFFILPFFMSCVKAKYTGEFDDTRLCLLQVLIHVGVGIAKYCGLLIILYNAPENDTYIVEDHELLMLFRRNPRKENKNPAEISAAKDKYGVCNVMYMWFHGNCAVKFAESAVNLRHYVTKKSIEFC